MTSDSQDAPAVTETPTLAQLEEARQTAIDALAFTTFSVSKNNGGLYYAPKEALQLIDELAAEVGEARLRVDQARERLRQAGETCSACGKSRAEHDQARWYPTLINCQQIGGAGE
jgi:hypothetical protein